MNTFEASNGNVVRSNDTGIYIDKGAVGLRVYPEYIDALREYFQHEASRQPWDDAKRGDVWLFWNEVDSQRALAWRGPDDWDVIDPRGNFHSGIADVAAEMESHSFYGWDKPDAKLIYRIEDAT